MCVCVCVCVCFGGARKRQNIAPHRRDGLHVEFLYTTSGLNNFRMLKTEKILMVYLMIWFITQVSTVMPAQTRTHMKVLFNHLEKCAVVGSQIDVALLSALSID